jgi:DNA-binding SARP family transcriptional activator/TolB-like protein/Tfp pilus assembly protein PilF
LQLKTFGGLALLADDGPVEGAGGQKRRLALLALLDAAGDRGLSRDKLLGYFWPDSDAEKARGSLAQALHALRKSLNTEDLFVGTNEVRLNRDRLTSDRADFLSRIAAGELESAVALYVGAYLDGFFLSDAPEFERWADGERASLQRQYAAALQKLARAASERDPAAAVVWWRKLAASDPMNAKHAAGLMRALAATGDRAGGIQHARAYEALIQQELGAPGDPDVRALAEELKQAPATSPNPQPSPSTAPPTNALPETMSTGEVVAVAMSRLQRSRSIADPAELARAIQTLPVPTAPEVLVNARIRRRTLALGVTCALVVAVVGFVVWRRPSSRPPVPTVAVGYFRNYTKQNAELAQPLTDMLATNLARAPGLQVVSTSRMLELMARNDAKRDTIASTMTAAREAGATQLLDGALYARDNGGYRLDLRGTDLNTGKVIESYTVENNDLFALVESVTKQIATTLGVAAPATPLADVMTHSIAAYRLYEEGLRSRAVGRAGALELFQAALKEDSTFAMAAYNVASINGSPRDYERAMRLANHTSDRERLIITTYWAQATNQAARAIYAESLVARYPSELEGYIALGQARFWEGDYLRAIPVLQRVVKMDTANLSIDPRDPNAPARCSACVALSVMGAAYKYVDSFPAAERMYRAWTAAQPGSIHAWGGLGELYYLNDRFDKALVTTQTTAAVAPQIDQTPFHMMIRLRAGEFALADEYWARQAHEGNLEQRLDALAWMTRSFRAQGRLREALQVARQARDLGTPINGEKLSRPTVAEGIVLLESGQFRSSAAVFDTLARSSRRANASVDASERLWALTLRACALAAGGDTASLGQLADTVEALGRVSAFAGAQHHVRGLLFQARGRLEDAEREYRAAISSPTNGFTQSNMRLAEVLNGLKRPRESAAVLGAALRGQEYGTSGESNRTSIHDMLARAFDAAQMRDSAVAHYSAVARAWAHADPVFAPALQNARDRIATLGARLKTSVIPRERSDRRISTVASVANRGRGSSLRTEGPVDAKPSTAMELLQHPTNRSERTQSSQWPARLQCLV